MKLNLVVLTPGKTEGKVIPITLTQFVIGRDPQCHLRPASAVISKRHCALLVREGRVFVRDFESTNGTFVNDRQIKGEIELNHEDRLKVGPLVFSVHMESTPAINRPTPAPPIKTAAKTGIADDESAAALLLSLQDDQGADSGSGKDPVPEGSTVMDVVIAPAAPAEGTKGEAGKGDDSKNKTKVATATTSSAAKAILDKYMRRPRS
jgi:pSer/pThr/pTyr-binding forkhead associated (FHA) protein